MTNTGTRFKHFSLAVLILVEHHFYENHEHRRIISLYAHLKEIKTKSGAVVEPHS